MSRLGALHLTQHTGPKHSGTVIFFHGSGSSGADMKEWVKLMVKNFSFPHIKVLYPTAPLQPYTPAGGQMSNVWFDRGDISPSAPEKLDSIANIEVEVKNLIKKENDAGIPSNRIIIGGFSMGGALSYHSAYRWDRNLAGTFVFSSFLNQNSIVYHDLKNAAGTLCSGYSYIHHPSIPDCISINISVQRDFKMKYFKGPMHVYILHVSLSNYCVSKLLSLGIKAPAHRCDSVVSTSMMIIFIPFWVEECVDNMLTPGATNIALPVFWVTDLSDKVPPLLQIHGDSDDLVDINWGQESYNQLKELGVQGELYIMERLGHSINKRGMNIIKGWIEKHLPEI